MNAKSKWLYKPRKVSGVTAEEEKPYWYGAPDLGDSAALVEIALEIAAETGMSVYQVLHVIEDNASVLSVNSRRFIVLLWLTCSGSCSSPNRR